MYKSGGALGVQKLNSATALIHADARLTPSAGPVMHVLYDALQLEVSR